MAKENNATEFESEYIHNSDKERDAEINIHNNFLRKKRMKNWRRSLRGSPENWKDTNQFSIDKLGFNLEIVI